MRSFNSERDIAPVDAPPRSGGAQTR